jgi:hypothetical protein
MRLLQAGLVAAGLWLVFWTAVPRFNDGPRRFADETTAFARLKQIYAAERQFMAAKAIDRDGDGRGEAGYFAELAGATPLRGGGGPLETPLLPPIFARCADGVVRTCGYDFELKLPTADGRWVGVAEAAAVGVDASEENFRVDAWPDAVNGTGGRSFFIDARGEPFVTNPR